MYSGINYAEYIKYYNNNSWSIFLFEVTEYFVAMYYIVNGYVYTVLVLVKFKPLSLESL